MTSHYPDLNFQYCFDAKPYLSPGYATALRLSVRGVGSDCGTNVGRLDDALRARRVGLRHREMGKAVVTTDGQGA